MYKLPMLKYKFDEDFMKHFIEEECTKLKQNLPNIIKNWRRNLAKHKEVSSCENLIDSLCSPFYYVASMLCILYGEKNISHFPLDWVPLIQRVAKGFVFN